MKILYTPLTMEDSEEFYRLAGDERVAATMRFDCPHTREESDRILADYIGEGNRTFALRFQPEENFWRFCIQERSRIRYSRSFSDAGS